MAVLKDLIVHGRSHFINGAQFNTINAESIGATAGIFDKLIATTLDANTATIDDLTAKNATVTALLDVQGDMHTNSWSNSNIATIDGSFYITPTSVSSDGSNIDANDYTPTGTITYASSNFTKISITGTFDTSQLTLNDNAHVAWPANSEVIVTGDVLVGTEWLPLGTIRGKLESQVAATNASKTISVIPLSTTLTDGQGHTPVTLEAIRTGINLSSGTSTALKMRKVKVSLTSRASGSTQYPVGILLSAQGTGTGQTFIDIYGGNNARNGQSGTINGSTKTFTKPMVRLGNLEGLPSLAGQTPSGWGIYTSNGFFEGAIVAKEGYIGNTGSYWTIGGGTSSGATYMYSGPSTISATTTEGTYLGTNGFLNVSAASVTNRPYAQITGGVLTAQGAIIQGALTASSLSTGGRTSSTSAAGTYIDSTGAIYGGSNKFIVTSDGVLTATGAIFKGIIIKNPNTNTDALIIDSNGFVLKGTDGNTYVDVSGFFVKLGYPGDATNGWRYNVYIEPTTGIQLRLGNQPLNTIDSTGMTLKTYDGVTVAQFNYASGVQFFKDNGDFTNTLVASFGESVRIGQLGDTHININADGIQGYNINGTNVLDILLSTQSLSINTNEYFDSPYLCSFTSSLTITKTITEISTLMSTASNSEFTLIINDHLLGNTYNYGEQATATMSVGSYTYSITYNGTNSFTITATSRYPFNISGIKFEQSVLAPAWTFGQRVDNSTIGGFSFVQGYKAIASGDYSHAEGNSTASASYSHAEGNSTQANGDYSHAEGNGARANGNCSHAEGNGTRANGNYSHAEGLSAIVSASAHYSHAEGNSTSAEGSCTHAEGKSTTARGDYSHAQNLGTRAYGEAQTAIGKYNADDTTSLFIIGNGNSSTRSNALTVSLDGDVTMALSNSEALYTAINNLGWASTVLV